MTPEQEPEVAIRASAWLSLDGEARKSPAGLNELAGLFSLINGCGPPTCRPCMYNRMVATVEAFHSNRNTTTMAKTTTPIQSPTAPAFKAAYQGHTVTILGEAYTAENLTPGRAKVLQAYGYGYMLEEITK